MRLRGVRRFAILATACALSLLACAPSAGAPTGRASPEEGTAGAAGRAATTSSGATESAAAPGLSPGGAAPGAPRHKARIAYVAQTTNMGVIDLAKQTGMFERYGVDAELTLVRNPLSVAAMLSGEVDFNFTGAHPIITANVEGADTVLVACGLSTPTWHIFGSRAIATTQDLRGARVSDSPGPRAVARTRSVPRWPRVAVLPRRARARQREPEEDLCVVLAA